MVAFLSLAMLFFAVIIDFGRVWLIAGEIQRALDAAALAGAQTVTVYVEVDKYGTVYRYEFISDPFSADSDARETFDQNTADLKDTSISWLDVVLDGTRVTVTSEFEVPTFLLRAFTTIPPKIRLTRQASADCVAIPLIP